MYAPSTVNVLMYFCHLKLYALSNSPCQFDDEPFNPDYTEADRILDVATQKEANGEASDNLYLILLFPLSIFTLLFFHQVLFVTLSVCLFVCLSVL